MVEAGKTERIQKILDTFGIDEAARDNRCFEKIVREEGPIWIDLIKSLSIEPIVQFWTAWTSAPPMRARYGAMAAEVVVMWHVLIN